MSSSNTDDTNEAKTTTTMDAAQASTQTSTPPVLGVAGRTNYAKWDKVATELVKEVEEQDQIETEEEKSKLGLDGKYARSQAEAEEREKFKQVKKTKKTLEKFKKRESAFIQAFPELLGPVVIENDDNNNNNNNNKSSTQHTQHIMLDDETKETEGKTVRITRDIVDAGKRVINICDTSGSSIDTDIIVLTLDLSHIESKMKPNTLLVPKSYKDDAENTPVISTPAVTTEKTAETTSAETSSETTADSTPETITTSTATTSDTQAQVEEEKYRKIMGIIKVFISNVHNCTIIIKCKIISGTVEIHDCTNVKIRVEETATVATVQADVSKDILLEFWDAPSGKNVPGTSANKTIYWGEDKDDRIFHAGITNMKVCIYRDGYLENEIICDYITDGAEAYGNASPKECQFVTSCIDGKLVTEKVIRAGSATGKNVRAMTERELNETQMKRDKAAKFAVQMAEDMIHIKDKDGNELVTKTTTITNADDDDVDKGQKQKEATVVEEEIIEEVYASMSTKQIQEIIDECDELKKRGNEAFAAGEYGQAILHYSLALDKSYELPDYDPTTAPTGTGTVTPPPAAVVVSSSTQQQQASTTTKALFPRDIILSNRSASFLKLGQHDKAEKDARMALQYNADNLKANFRLGLALHAQSKYEVALPILAKAYKMEPKNKQIQQALQFCEVRLEQERRKRFEG